MGDFKSEKQYIKTDSPLEDFEFSPKQVRDFETSNIFQRVIAHLIGYFGNVAKRLQCTSAGILKVAITGSGFSHNDTKTGTAGNEYGANIIFDAQVSAVDVFVWDSPAMIKRSMDGTSFDDEIEVPAGSAYSFECGTTAINIKNKTAGSNSRYSIVGYY